MKIKEIKTRIIFDTRGQETIEVDLMSDENLISSASVASGKSKSSQEPKFLSATECLPLAKELVESGLKKINLENPVELDEALLTIDGTSDKSKLGANLILAISIAARRLLALKKKVFLWQGLQEELKAENTLKTPIFLFNLIEGGVHAANNLIFQEYLVAVNKENAKKNLEIGLAIYKKVKNLYPNVGLGDENGFSFNFENSIKPFDLLKNILEDLNLAQNVKIGIDAAAANFYKNNSFFLDGKQISHEELILIYESLINYFGISYLEDPFDENNFEHFAKLTQKYQQTVIAGDDLTSTNPGLIKQAIEQKSISGVIIKPSQIGTVKEIFDAIRIAKENNIKIIVSHRSGETNDDFICHLAKACGAYALKFGAPAKDRIFKYNEMLKIME